MSTILHNGPFTLQPYNGTSQVNFDLLGRDGEVIAEVNFRSPDQADIFLICLNSGYEKYILDNTARSCPLNNSNP